MVSSISRSPKRWASGGLWDMTGRAKVTTFIGAGGKTTCLQGITREIDSAGLPVIVTTTTKVYPEEHMKSWKNLSSPPCGQESACFWYAKVEDESGKWIGPARNVVDAAIAADMSKRFWMIEGDGARERKLKCWGINEPQIPLSSECAVLVVDRDLWGKVLQEKQVHRSELCQDLLGHVWNAERAWSYFLGSPVFAHGYGHLSWVILLNSAEISTKNKELVYTKDPVKYFVSRGPIETPELLQDLCYRWQEIQQDFEEQKPRPKHLRVAAGDAKEGKLQWFDLW